MDVFICNKCFATLSRGKKPFYLTQCGHIYCQGCVQQAEKQCFQCKQVGVFSVALQEPSLSKVEHFFLPVNESLAALQKTDTFQQGQVKVMQQRFHEVDKKYQVLKSRYFNTLQSMKSMEQKYYKLKAETEQLKQNLMSSEMRNSTTHSSSKIYTPMNPIDQRGTSRSSGSQFSRPRSYGTNTITSNESYNSGNNRITADGFRIPSCRPARSVGSCSTSDTNSTYTFRK